MFVVLFGTTSESMYVSPPV